MVSRERSESGERAKQIADLRAAIAAQEAQRATLGNSVVSVTVQALRERLSALEAAPATDEAELRYVTVLFADVSGFTAMSEKLAPEDVRAFQNDMFPRMAAIVREYEGFVEKYIGDALVAVFGAPVAHEDDAERAVRAALAMRERMERLNERWAAHVGRPLTLHVGINTGPVVAGEIGGARGGGQYAVTGDTTNTAARIQAAAAGSQILIGPATQRLTAHAFELRALVQLKGKAEPVPVFEVLGVRAERGGGRGLEGRGISSPLVGREEHLRSVIVAVERTLAGEGGVVGVLGEAGVGKSRLLAEVRRLTPEVAWLEGRALSYSQSISYWPFIQMVRRDSGITDADSEATAWEKLSARAKALFQDGAAEYVPYLATMLAIPVPGELVERVRYLGGDAMRRQVFLSVRRYVEQAARARPLVLVLEDLQWADRSSIELLEHLLPLVRTVPLLVVGTSRLDPDTPGARVRELVLREYAEHYVEVRLEPLGPEESAQLLRNLLPVDDLPARVRDSILAKADGNPFFVEEVIRALIDLGVVVRDPRGGRWQATPQAERITIPDTLKGVVLARLDRLGDDVRHAVRLASVIGRSFLMRVLKAIAEEGDRLDTQVAELQALELVRERSREPELEYIFKHAVVQEATYESILLSRRRELHRQVAECIEALFPQRLDEFAGLLAYHYARAEAWEKAQEYLFRAGDQAGSMAADAEALAHYEEAMAAYARAFGDTWDPVQRAVLERKIGEALFRRGRHAEAEEHILRALELLGHPYPKDPAGVRRETLRQLLVQVAHRRLSAFLVKRPVAEPDRVAAERAQIYNVLSWIDYFARPKRLPLDVLAMLNVSEKHGIGPNTVRGLMGVGLICDHVSLFALAQRYSERAVALAEELGQLPALGQAHMGLAYHYDHLADWDKTLHHYRRASDAYLQAGDIRGYGPCATRLTWLPVLKGSAAEGVARAQEIIRLGQNGADRQLEAWGTNTLGRCLNRAGRLAEAEAHLRQAIELFLSVPDQAWAGVSRGDLGWCVLRQGNLDEAQRILEEARRIQVEQGFRGLMQNGILNPLSQMRLAVAERAPAGQRAALLKEADGALRLALKEARHAREGASWVYRLRGTYEWLRGNQKAAAQWWDRSAAEAETVGNRFDLGLTHLEVGRRLSDSARLRQAEAIFDDLEAAHDLAVTRQALAALA